MGKLVDCRHVFSNGSEYEWFLEHNCDRCTRYRKGRCRIYRRIEMARFDEKFFPYADLMEYERYAGKECRQFTEEKQERTRTPRQLDGQIGMEGLI